MKDAPAPAPREETDLLEGWITARLSDLCEINPPKPRRDALPSGAAVTFVPMPAVDAEQGAIVNGATRPFSQVSKGFTAFRDGDVIMAKITPCMENGKAAIARGLSSGLGFGSTEFHVFRPLDGILAEYLFYFIRQKSFRGEAEAEMTGSVGQKRVPVEFVRGVEIPLPPLAEQKRIVAKVEELLAHVNAARERLAKVPAILKRFRQSVLAAACTGTMTRDCQKVDGNSHTTLLTMIESERQRRLGAKHFRRPPEAISESALTNLAPLPKAWAWVRLEQVCDFITKGTTPASEKMRSNGHVPFIKIQHLTDTGKLGFSSAPVFIDRETHQSGQMARSRVIPGDVLINIVGPPLGQAALVPDSHSEWNTNQAIAILRALPGLEPRFLLLNVLSSRILDWAVSKAKTTVGQHNLTLEIVRDLPIPLPPIAEQHEVVHRVDALFALADAIEAKVATATARADALTQSILAKAFRGELVETEASLARREGRAYEPTSALLERIHHAKVEADGAAEIHLKRSPNRKKVRS